MAKKLMSVFGGGNAGAPEGESAGTEAVDTDAGAVQTGAQNTPNRLPVIVLGKTLAFKGELSADEDMMLFGRVEGSIHHSSNLTVGIGGVVVGNIRAKVLTVKGTVEGDIEASESVTIAPTANVSGDVVAPRVCIVEGAQFNGAVEMPDAPRVQPAAASEPLAEQDVGELLGGR
jgi:cytoskeletal protein CcmA (bactofilin family)